MSLIILVLLGILLYTFVIRAYFVNYVSAKQQEAYALGYQQAVTQVVQEVSKCQGPVPLLLGNTTTNIISLDCASNS